MKKQCPLCQTQANEFFKDTQTYYKCSSCYGIFVDKDDLVDKQSEKERYELHSDDVGDEGYKKFVSPITSSIMNDYKASDVGLDFGAGTSTIIASVLNEYDYDIKNYDPFFHDFHELLEKKVRLYFFL
ncbi:MAG: zf-TFIIB domain-containing protein [Sulfurimonas sp.]|nr:zf-TFIIB domain-containing protein [Sulfurimonas sp.]